MDFVKRIFRSTNGTLHAALLIILGIGLFFKFPGADLVALITAAVSFVGLVREWFKGGIKFEWASNALAYIAAGLVALLPNLAALIEAGQGLAEAIASGNMNLILPAAILFFNILWQQLRGGGDDDGETRQGPWGNADTA
jgi:hypothetical protein